jgi:hypothetical protein
LLNRAPEEIGLVDLRQRVLKVQKEKGEGNMYYI